MTSVSVETNDKSLHTQCGKLAIKSGHAAARVADIVKLGLGDVRLDVLARLDNGPDGPHGVRRRAPGADGILERRGGQVRGRGAGAVLEIGGEKGAALGGGRVARGVEQVRGRPVVVGCPFVEVVRDVKRGWIRRGVLKIDDDDLFFCMRCIMA